jgi:phage tail sheath protein FI
MVDSYKTPGVYVEEISTAPPSIAQVETAIPAFIGYTEKATRKAQSLSEIPTRISSLLEYEEFFGGPQSETGIEVTLRQTIDARDSVTAESLLVTNNEPSKYILYYSLQSFFANGGGPCYIVSVGAYTEQENLDVSRFEAGLAALEKEDEPTLIVFPEAQRGLTANKSAGHFTLINKALARCEQLQDRFVIMDTHQSGEALTASSVIDYANAFRSGVTSAATRYGAAYMPNLQAVLAYSYAEGDVSIRHRVTRSGKEMDGDLDDITLAAVKDVNGGLFSQIKAEISSLPVTIPPSGAMAGVYARVDDTRGVWKAPANVGLIGVSGLTLDISDEVQEHLNVDPAAGKSINAIRAFADRGILVWGARTLDGNDEAWRYVPVRRFCNMVEESIEKATGTFVFEPNDKNTWAKVRAMIENFLLLQWRAGALAGAAAEQAFYVNIGLGETMTALDILEGRMNVEIGMAVVRPAEFIILTFSQIMPEA